MPDYNCPRCGYNTYKKSRILRHINRKIPCKPKLEDVNVKEISNEIINSSVLLKKKDLIKGNKELIKENKELKEENKELKEEPNKENKKVEELEEEILKLKSRLYKNKNTGYIYILHNDMFQHYGSNVYKIGCSNYPHKRLLDFTTSYPLPSKIIYISTQFEDKLKAEKTLFKLIKPYRMEKNREFFQLELEEIIENINKVENTLTD
jgi:hypothetical protein